MANIEMNYYNGSTYEVLYPYVNLSNSTGSLNISSRTTGTLPLNRGGTAGTSATSGLYNLINGCSTVTNTGLTTGDYFPLQDVSASNAKKITVNNLINYLESNLDIGGSTSITSGTYYGTGSNQTVIVNTSIQPKVFFLYCGGSQTEGRVVTPNDEFIKVASLCFITAICNPTSSDKFHILTGYSEEIYGATTIQFNLNSVTISYSSQKGSLTPDLAFNERNVFYVWVAIG